MAAISGKSKMFENEYLAENLDKIALSLTIYEIQNIFVKNSKWP